MNLIGDINTFLDCLGLDEGDSDILSVITIIAMDFDIEELNDEGINQRYYKFNRRGVGFIFDKNGCFTLNAIFFHVEGDDEYMAYPFLNTLVNGISYFSSIVNVVSLLGAPERQGMNWVRYKLDEKYIHFEFKNKILNMITIFID
ncbi:hypothetical protein OA57_11660 [Chelonobacter oris]|uniref:Uncharacterized protein n=2 Tax=Chelonobacter oris TaxID=505317 RepID=A0A0A3AJC4_9PAST|nr:hypothetical protein OA57_11660 [Chelonobacter oris]